MSSPFDRAIQFCESLFRGFPPPYSPSTSEENKIIDDDDASVHSWTSMDSFRKSVMAPLVPQQQEEQQKPSQQPQLTQRKEPLCHHTSDGRCVSNISSGNKVLMFDEKTFQFKLTDPL